MFRKLLKQRLDRSEGEGDPWNITMNKTWKKRLDSGEELNYFTWEKICQQKEKVSRQEERVTKQKRRRRYLPYQGTGAFGKMEWVGDIWYWGREEIGFMLVLSVSTPRYKYQWQEENLALKDHVHGHKKGWKFNINTIRLILKVIDSSWRKELLEWPFSVNSRNKKPFEPARAVWEKRLDAFGGSGVDSTLNVYSSSLLGTIMEQYMAWLKLWGCRSMEKMKYNLY